jgi:hypothetical protein
MVELEPSPIAAAALPGCAHPKTKALEAIKLATFLDHKAPGRVAWIVEGHHITPLVDRRSLIKQKPVPILVGRNHGRSTRKRTGWAINTTVAIASAGTSRSMESPRMMRVQFFRTIPSRAF